MSFNAAGGASGEANNAAAAALGGFELGDLLADGALGEVQFLGRAGETQVTGHRFKTLQRGDRREMAFAQHNRLVQHQHEKTE